MSLASPWLKASSAPHPPRRRAVFLPYAGAGVGMFFGWRRHLPSDVQICGLQLPGREERSREPFCGDLSEASRRCLEALGPQLDRPYAIFAHSLGAMLALELVHALAAHALPLPDRLVISGANPPHLARRHDIDRLDDAALLSKAAAWGGDSLQGLPESVRAHALRTLRADIGMLDRHVFQWPDLPPVPIEVHGGRDDPLVPSDALAAWQDWRDDICVSLHDGGHFFFRGREALFCDRLTG